MPNKKSKTGGRHGASLPSPKQAWGISPPPTTLPLFELSHLECWRGLLCKGVINRMQSLSGAVLSPSASRLFRVRRTVSTMLHKRGYVVPEKMLNLSAEDFKAEFVGGGDEPNLERMSMLLFKESNELDRIYVYFAEGDVGFPQIKLCVAADEEGASVRAHARAFFPSPPHSNTTSPPLPYTYQPTSLLSRLKDEGAKRAILVRRTGCKLLAHAKMGLAEMQGDHIVEDFMEAELLVNITEHELVPEHIVLTDQEKQDLLARYKMRESQLPRISFSDPVARFFGMQRGQVVKIVRPSETAGRYVSYRVVV